MHDPASSHDELKGFEAQLAALAPRARLDRDRLMFAAGRRAGARPLRIANRLLATASVALAALLAGVVALPRSSSEQNVRPEPPRGTGATLAETGHDDTPALDAARQPLALVDGPTNFRLRQRFMLGFDDHAAQPTQSFPDTEDSVEPSQPNDARSLLKRYLNNTPDRL
jgi:hypothetical protein